MSSSNEFRFNKTALQALPIPSVGRRAVYYDTEVRGLQLRITDKGARSFSVLRRVKGGEPERITVGNFPALSVERARNEAKNYLADLGAGVSVRAQQRRSKLAGKTLYEVHRDYLASRGVTLTCVTSKDGAARDVPNFAANAKLKPLTVRDYIKVIAKHLADWNDKPLAKLTREMIEARHRELSKASPAQANLAMRYVRALFTFASDDRDADGRPIILDNPVRRLSALKLWNRVDRRRRYLEPHQFPVWWNAVEALINEPQYRSREVLGDYLKVLLFTGLRRDEALRLRWENVDLKSGTLTVVDTKNRSDHLLPMGKCLQSIIARRRKATDSEWVFANPLTGTRITDPQRQIVNVSKASGIEFSAHDLRRTFASIVSRLGDRLSYYTTKRLLNHRSSDVTQGYVQFDIEQLREAMQAVEDFALKHVRAGGTVVPMSKTERRAK